MSYYTPEVVGHYAHLLRLLLVGLLGGSNDVFYAVDLLRLLLDGSAGRQRDVRGPFITWRDVDVHVVQHGPDRACIPRV